MKNMLMSLLCFLGLIVSNGHAVDKIIYGEDNRFDLVNSPFPLYNDLAKSTMAMIRKERLSSEGDSPFFSIDKNVKTLKNE